MSVSMRHVNQWIDEYLERIKSPYKSWKELKANNKDEYNELVDLAFDELHPY